MQDTNITTTTHRISLPDLASLKERKNLIDEVAEELNALHYTKKFLEVKYQELINDLAEKYRLDETSSINMDTGEIEKVITDAEFGRSEDTSETATG
jgi:hypothetical protein|tara:strand:+ start:1350 stop:1640 length:291 start_codon:yes stop_codon:yes gene_type:complete